MEAINKEEMIKLECEDHGPFLQPLREPIMNHFSGKEVSQGDVILHIQNLARSHYEYLWNACTREEQYILYDLAQDGLVNSKNIQVILALVEKGILVYDGSLQMMNRSFRNYILTAIRPEEAVSMQREALNNGAWSAIKGPLILIVIALVSFLSLTQQDTYKQAIALLGTLTASVPLVIRLLGTTSSTFGKGVEKE